MNPNDSHLGGYGQKKKQFQQSNQHYISHNSVIPAYDLQNWMQGSAQSIRSPEQSPTKSKLQDTGLQSLQKTNTMQDYLEHRQKHQSPQPLHRPSDVLMGVTGPYSSPVRTKDQKQISPESLQRAASQIVANDFSNTKVKGLLNADSLFDPYQRNVTKILSEQSNPRRADLMYKHLYDYQAVGQRAAGGNMNLMTHFTRF